DGETAMEVTACTGYDVVVLDRDLPRVHGDAVCASLVAGSRVPARARILMLTASAAVSDRVDGLNLGADDYLLAQAVKACGATPGGGDAVAKCKAQAQTSLQKAALASAAFQRDQTLTRLLYYSLGALAVVAAGSAWLGWIVAGRALRPVHAITAAARAASEENLAERIALAGPQDELKELADTFDAMLARLDAAFD